MGLDFLYDLGSRISDVTGDKRDTDFLFQRLSIALQKGNAACMYKPGPLIDTLEWRHGIWFYHIATILMLSGMW